MGLEQGELEAGGGRAGPALWARRRLGLLQRTVGAREGGGLPRVLTGALWWLLPEGQTGSAMRDLTPVRIGAL